MPDLQSCWYILQGDILSNQDTIFKEIITREIGWNKKRCCCCRRGEKVDCCSNLVFTENGTRTWAKKLVLKRLEQKTCMKKEKRLEQKTCVKKAGTMAIGPQEPIDVMINYKLWKPHSLTASKEDAVWQHQKRTVGPQTLVRWWWRVAEGVREEDGGMKWGKWGNKVV